MFHKLISVLMAIAAVGIILLATFLEQKPACELCKGVSDVQPQPIHADRKALKAQYMDEKPPSVLSDEEVIELASQLKEMVR